MVSIKETLLRRVELSKSTFSNAIDIVDHLRSNYSDYNRCSYIRLLYSVQNALDSLKSDNKAELKKLSVSKKGNSGGGGDVKKWPMFKDLSGDVMEKIKNSLEIPLTLMCQPKLCTEFGLKPVTGILLHGPPGCGKTKLAHAIANEVDVPFYPISATHVDTSLVGASENNIREIFSKAKKTAPSIISIDEIDAIAMKRQSSSRYMTGIEQLLTCMDEACNSSGSSDEPTGHVLVIGATNRLDAIDSALRRPGRFTLEIDVGIPDESAREAILLLHTRNCSDNLDSSVDLQKIARSTPGFVGADLEALVVKAGELALGRIIDERKRELPKDLTSETNAVRWKKPWLPQEINRFVIKMTDFEEAVKMAQPSLRREGFSPIPDVKWEYVGALDHVREEFDQHIVKRIKNPDVYEGLGLDRDTGFLLYGPPGCGKTLIAKAVANEAGANFIYIKGPELLNVGENESGVKKLFDRARACAPCILFFDEVDALTDHGDESVRKQLQIELDSKEQRRGIFVIGATNRPEVIDSALLRPGRFGNHTYIPVPSPDGRVSILKALAMHKEALARRMENRARFKLMPIDACVNLSSIAKSKACTNFSGADLAALMDKAILTALEEKLTTAAEKSDKLTVEARHFKVALSKVSPSVSKKQREHYEKISKVLKAA
ncbi:hypothetical protein P8452_25856 [Trifolium repens]|nr:hypothetical protein P8452_25856 [Trifolium repens]